MNPVTTTTDITLEMQTMEVELAKDDYLWFDATSEDF